MIRLYAGNICPAAKELKNYCQHLKAFPFILWYPPLIIWQYCFVTFQIIDLTLLVDLVPVPLANPIMAISPNLNESRASMLMAIIWVVTSISTTLATCRLFTRVTILKAAGKDDVALVLSVVLLSSPLTQWWAYIASDNESHSSNILHDINKLRNRKTSSGPLTSKRHESY